MMDRGESNPNYSSRDDDVVSTPALPMQPLYQPIKNHDWSRTHACASMTFDLHVDAVRMVIDAIGSRSQRIRFDVGADMTADLAGKVALVTGGARGLGRAYSEALAKAGAAVLVADVLEKEGRATVAAIVSCGGRAAFRSVDVADEVSTEAMARFAASEFGGIDILVNNAAIFASLRIGSLNNISVDRWDRTLAVNVKGPWLCIKAVTPYMRQRGGGAIVNQSSTAAFGLAGVLDYATSKAALIGLTKSAAAELGRDNIRVNAIAPGGVTTEAYVSVMGDLKVAEDRAKANQLIATPITPADVVGTLLHLVSDASRLITGQTFVVDGGRFFLG